MSYLLEALKKAEEDRLKLEDSKDSLPPVAHFKSSLPMGIIVLVIIILFATVIKLFSEPLNEQNNEFAAPPVAQSTVHPEVSEYILKSGELLIEPGVVQPQLPIELPESLITHTDSNETANIIEASQARQLSELSPQELNTIPSLSLESHLYSTVAQYSSVVINGTTYSESDLLSSGVILKKINANGIVISVGGNLVELPKGITWMSSSYAK
jgi:hypothetical protein